MFMLKLSLIFKKKVIIIKAMSFTGRRPKDLFGYDKEKYRPIVDKLEEELIRFHLEEGFDTHITGGAQGFDQCVFWAVNRMKRLGYNVRNVLYIPFYKQENKWLKTGLFSQEEYRLMLSLADEVHCCNPNFDVLKEPKWKITSNLHARNHEMVADSVLVFGLYPGDGWMDENNKGGTSECLRYAREQQKTIYQMNPFTLECCYPLAA